jgi:hypothetical protein
LKGLRKQIALLPLAAIRYNPYHQQWEKRLARHLSFHWRVRARSAAYATPFSVKGLLLAVGIGQNTERRRCRIRARLEAALNVLEQDGVIRNWQYQKWDEEYMKSRGWFELWLTANIVIEPPDIIPTTYQSIVQHRARGRRDDVAERVQRLRIHRGNSILFMAEQIGIEAAVLSEIENGRRQPSRSVRRRIEKYLTRNPQAIT